MNDETMIFDSSMGEQEKALETIGKYRIDSILGQGAMGIVYKAFDPFMKREVAIKLIHKDLIVSSAGEEVSTRFRLEAQAAGRFSPHSNIVTVYEFGEEDGQPYIVMEYIHGKTLKQWLKADTKFSLQHTYSIMSQLLNGLYYSHTHNVVHRDIKPDNIFLLDSGQVKITDFGIAKIDQTGVTQQGIRIGTPSYMSPEQIEGKPVDGRSDLFSAGVIFYELLVGEKPFSGDSMASLLHQVVNTQPVSVSIANEQLPKSFDAVVKKALAKNADNRFQNGHDFAAAIKDILEAGTAKSSKSKMSTNQIMVLGGSGVLALFLVGGGLWWFSSSDDSPQKIQMQPPNPSVEATLPVPPERTATLYPAESSRESLPKPEIPSDIYLPASSTADIDVQEQSAEISTIETETISTDHVADSFADEELTQMAKVEETPLIIPPLLPTFEASVFYTSSSGLLNELNSGDTLTPSDNYYLTFQPNEEQYLYVAQIDSLGGIYPIFPNEQFSKVSNPLPSGVEYKIPEESNLFLDFNVGKEKIYFIASMEQVNSLELLFDELQRADGITRKELAKEFIDIFEAYNPDSTHSLWFWHK